MYICVWLEGVTGRVVGGAAKLRIEEPQSDWLGSWREGREPSNQKCGLGAAFSMGNSALVTWSDGTGNVSGLY